MHSSPSYYVVAGFPVMAKPFFRPNIDRTLPVFESRGPLYWAYVQGTPEEPYGNQVTNVIVEYQERRVVETTTKGTWEVVFTIVPHIQLLGGSPVTGVPGLGEEYAYMAWGDYCRFRKRVDGYPLAHTGAHLRLVVGRTSRNALQYVHRPTIL